MREPAPSSRGIKCPFCGEETVCHDEMLFWKCPCCGCEIWPEEENGRRAIREAFYEDTRRGWKKGGGKTRSKRFKNKKTAKPLPTERYVLS